MQTWQIAAGVVTVALLCTAAYLLRGNHRPSNILFVLLLVPIPAAGFFLYSIAPGPPPAVTLITVVASFLVALAIFPAFYGFSPARSFQGTPQDFSTMNRYFLARCGCGLLGVIGFLFMFEPWFAWVNLAAIIAWLAIWTPRRARLVRYEVSADITASTNETFQFLLEPANWSRYQDIEVLSVKPDGPIAAGTELTMRRLIRDAWDPAAQRWPVMQLYKITAIVGTSYTLVSFDHSESHTIEVRPIRSGSTIDRRVQWLLPFTDAILGRRFDLRRQIANARELQQRNIQRLNELIGQPLPDTG